MAHTVSFKSLQPQIIIIVGTTVLSTRGLFRSWRKKSLFAGLWGADPTGNDRKHLHSGIGPPLTCSRWLIMTILMGNTHGYPPWVTVTVMVIHGYTVPEILYSLKSLWLLCVHILYKTVHTVCDAFSPKISVTAIKAKKIHLLCSLKHSLRINY